MSYIYAIEENTNKKHLIFIECDHCGNRIKPYKEISESGWIKIGYDNGIGTDKFESICCPKCK